MNSQIENKKKSSSGYRKFHSCETAVTKIHNDILMLVDKKENVVLLLLDLSAAFDTINHKLLLSKLRYNYGIAEVALDWLKNYLSNKSFTGRLLIVGSQDQVTYTLLPSHQ